MAGRERPLPPPSVANLNPPVAGYVYFDGQPHSFDPALGPGSARTRWLLSECALMAYDSEERIRAAFGAAHAITFVSGEFSGFCFAADLGPRDAVLAFRGTQVVLPGDGLEKFESTVGDYITDLGVGPLQLPDGSLVHQKFHDSARELVTRLQENWEAGPRRWWLCGHSLGGALAVLAAQRMQQAGHTIGGVITFGQPRVGDARHAQSLAALPLHRVVHGCDLVPFLPPDLSGFVHGGREKLFRPELRKTSAMVRRGLARPWEFIRYGTGALAPFGLRDHAPIFYATLCYNAWASEP